MSVPTPDEARKQEKTAQTIFFEVVAQELPDHEAMMRVAKAAGNWAVASYRCGSVELAHDAKAIVAEALRRPA